MKTISPQALKPLLTNGAEIAFLDIREHGQYGEGHPFFCVPLPYSLLEARATVMLPCLHVSIVLMDDNSGVAEKAALRLTAIGYTDVSALDGGVSGWQAAGYNLFKGVNVPSKTFGELVEHNTGTPSISAEELKALQDSGAPLALLDGRPGKEFTAMSLPGAQSCPNAELGYRAAQLFPHSNTTIVINCAGRTRSIIGAESLRQCGQPNPVYALRNGTQGWRLAGLELKHGELPDALPELTSTQLAQNKRQAADLVQHRQLNVLSTDTLKNWLADENQTTYLLDVRSAEEYATAHWPGSRHAPGGQLVQATDEYVAVRGARLVLCDDTGLRAAITAMWLGGMGHNVSILQSDVSTVKTQPLATVKPQITAPELTGQQAADSMQHGAVLLDASRSMQHRKSHPQGAIWVTRARLPEMARNQDSKFIVTGTDASLIAGVVTDLASSGCRDVSWLPGTTDAWQASGFTMVETPDSPTQDECIDYLFFVHDRHAGNLDAARQYLEWETGLLAQLDDQERGVLKPPPPGSEKTASIE